MRQGGRDLRAGSVDRRVVGLGIRRTSRSLGLLGAAHLAHGNGTVRAEHGKSNVLVKNLSACCPVFDKCDRTESCAVVQVTVRCFLVSTLSSPVVHIAGNVLDALSLSSL